MKIYRILSFLLFLLHFQTLTAQQVVEMSGNPQERVYHKGTIGNVISNEEFFQLMTTGNYISIPVMNPLTLDWEFIIKEKKTNNDSRYQTFTDGGNVLSTIGAENLDFKYSMGDTLLTICGLNIKNNINCIGKGNVKSNKTLMVVADKRSWAEIKDDLSRFISLSQSFQSLDFMICLPRNQDSFLTDIFSNRFLKKEKRIYLAKYEDILDFPIGNYPYYYLISETGRIELLSPPFPHSPAHFRFIDKFLEKNR